MIVIPSKYIYGVEKDTSKEFNSIKLPLETYSYVKKIEQNLSANYSLSTSNSFKEKIDVNFTSRMHLKWGSIISNNASLPKFKSSDSNVIDYKIDLVTNRRSSQDVTYKVKTGHIAKLSDGMYDWDNVSQTQESSQTSPSYYFEAKLNDYLYINTNDEDIIITYGDNAERLSLRDYFLEKYPNSWVEDGGSYSQGHSYIKIECVDERGRADNTNYLCLEIHFGKDVRLNMTADITVLQSSSNETIIGNRYANDTISFSKNSLLQSTSQYGDIGTQYYYNNLLSMSQIDTIELKCAIADYYDYDGKIVIAKDGSTNKMAFLKYDEVIPFKLSPSGEQIPLVSTDDGLPIYFSAVGVGFDYNGKILQTLKLQEKGFYIPGTKGLAYLLNNSGDSYTCIGLGTSTEKDIVFPSYQPSSDGFEAIEVSAIGESAFKGTDITSIQVTSSIATINDYAFQNCSQLSSITLDEGVSTIGNGAFANCEALEKIYFNATDMNDLDVNAYAFSYCGNNGNGIKVIIGKNVTKIPSSLFSAQSLIDRPNIVSVEFEEGSICESIGALSFNCCSSLTNITIPNGVTSIGRLAFQSCTHLTSITLPNSITSIVYGAFKLCNSLTDIYYDGTINEWNALLENITAEGNDALFNATVHCKNYEYTKSSDETYYAVIGIGDMPVGDMVIPSTYRGLPVKRIGTRAFENSKITSVTIPDSVTNIDLYAFKNCSELLSVNIGNGVTTIGSSVFEGCSKLNNINIPNSVKTISGFVFRNCTSLIGITIPDSVTSIGSRICEGCTNLTSITVDENNAKYTSINGNLYDKKVTNLLQYCIGKASILFTIPETVRVISSYSFYGSGLVTIRMYSSVSSISASAFENCVSLRYVDYYGTSDDWNSITIGSDNTYLVNAQRTYLGLEYTQSGSGYLVSGRGDNTQASIDIPSIYKGASVTGIAPYALSHQSDITFVRIPNTIHTIGAYAFAECSNLDTIYIPNSVNSIGTNAFLNCPIKRVHYSGTRLQWIAISIETGNDSLKEATIYYNS